MKKNYTIEIKNLTISFNGTKNGTNNYIIYKKYAINLNDIVELLNKYYQNKSVKLEIFYLDIILELMVLGNDDNYKSALKLFNIIRNVKNDNIVNSFVKNYLEKIIEIFVDVPDNKFFNLKFYTFCYFYLNNLIDIKILFTSYPINLVDNPNDYNSDIDFELDNSDVKKELEIEFTDIGDILDKVWDDLVWFGT